MTKPSDILGANQAGGRRLFLVAALLCFLGGIGLVYAYVNEAISLALEAATPYVEEGFEVREDNWSGEVEAGQTTAGETSAFSWQ